MAVAAVLEGPYGEPYRIIERQISRPAPTEALVRIQYSGVCHGDVYSQCGGGPAPAQAIRPLVGGHEGVGEIIELGSESQSFGFSVGDVVGIAWRHKVCQNCEACRAAAENFCPQQEVTGMHTDGTFQSHITFPLSQLARIPPALNRAVACTILCAGVTSYTALRKLYPQRGRWCVISGAAGGLGHLAIQYAKYFGLKVLSIDGGDTRKEDFCRKMGSDEYLDFVHAGDGLVDQVRSITGGDGAPYVLLLSPSQAAYNAAIEYVGFRGQIMAVGIGNCHLPLRPALWKDVSVSFSQTGTISDIEEALQITADGMVKPEVTLLGLHDLNVALEQIKRGEVSGKLVVSIPVPDKTQDQHGTRL